MQAFARGDWGDGATGAGLELAVGLRFRNLPRRLGIGAELRTLVAHSTEDARERSANVGLSLLPRTDGTGLQGSVTWRQGARNGVDAMMNGIAPWTVRSARSLEAERNWVSANRLGYGIALRHGLAMPFVEFDVGRFEGAGARFGVRHQFGDRGRGLNVQWSIGQGQGAGTGNGIVLRAVGRF